MGVDETIKLISQVGFPIVVTGYLLIRMERTLKELVGEIKRLVLFMEARGKGAPE